MTKDAFELELRKAQTMNQQGDRADYWNGYIRGLRQGYYGEKCSTPKECQQWMGLAQAPGLDPQRAELGQGYLDGLKAAR
jgi:hypothetical protein